MNKSLRDIIIISFSTITLTLLVWLPHILAIPNFYNLNFLQGFSTIYKNFDGLEYIVIAKSFYDPVKIASIPQSLPANYYAAHFPGYGLAILILAPILGMLKSMLFVALLFTVASAITFYFLVKDFKLSSNPLLLSLVFLILPARWLIVHSIGSSEPMFIFFVITSLYFFMKYEMQNNLLFLFSAASLGLSAQLTRPPGILLFLAYGIYLFWKYKYRILIKVWSYYLLLLIPLGLLGVFYWFSIAYQDFWAYFHSGDNIHLAFPPFQVFNKNQFWVGEHWLEDIVFVFLIGLSGGLVLLKQRLYPLAFFVLTYLGASSLIAHRDISRYTLPIFPFVLIAFEKFLVSKEFRIVLIILSLAIYLYAQNFLINNVAPVANLSAYD